MGTPLRVVREPARSPGSRRSNPRTVAHRLDSPPGDQARRALCAATVPAPWRPGPRLVPATPVPPRTGREGAIQTQRERASRRNPPARLHAQTIPGPPAGCRARPPAGRASVGPAAGEVRLRLLGQGQAPGRVRGADRVSSPLAASCSSPNSRTVSSMRVARLAAVRPSRHRRSRLWSTRTAEPVEHVESSVSAGADRLGRLQRAAAGEDGQAAEQRLLRGGRAGRSSRRSRRASSAGGPAVARPAGQQRQPAAPAAPAAPGGEKQLDPRRGQLDRQRQPVQPPADLGHGRGVLRRSGRSPAGRPARRCDEQAHRRHLRPVVCHRRQAARVAAAPAAAPGTRARRQTQRRPAGDQHRQPRAGRQQLADQRGRRQHLLEVVQHQQQVLRPRSAATRRSAERLLARPPARRAPARSAGTTRSGSRQRRERDEGDAVGEVVGPARSATCERQAGLADAAGTGQGQQPHLGAAQQGRDRRRLPLPADERRQRAWEAREGTASCTSSRTWGAALRVTTARLGDSLVHGMRSSASRRPRVDGISATR